MPERRSVESAVLRAACVALLIVGCVAVAFPFLIDLLWALVLCYTTWPVYARLLRWLGGRRTLAASLMTLLLLLILLTPFAVIAARLGDDIPVAADRVRAALATTSSGAARHPPAWLTKIPLLGTGLSQFWLDLASGGDARTEQLRQLVEPLKSWLFVAASALMAGLVHMALSLLILLFLYRDGAAIAAKADRATDLLGGERGRGLLMLAGRTVRSVVYGILGTALVQGVVAGIGFLIAGVPQVALLTLLTIFLSLIPIGPPLVWGPVALVFFMKGSIGWGVFMVIWGILVSSVDNVVKPFIISKGGGGLPFILILLGILGGAVTFGFIGVFVGPTLLAVGFEMFKQWTAPAVVPATGGLVTDDGAVPKADDASTAATGACNVCGKPGIVHLTELRDANKLSRSFCMEHAPADFRARLPQTSAEEVALLRQKLSVVDEQVPDPVARAQFKEGIEKLIADIEAGRRRLGDPD